MKKKYYQRVLSVLIAILFVFGGLIKGGTEPALGAPSKPAITKVEVSETSSNGYRVTAVFTAPAGVKEVLMPTWTEKNGQDDLLWHKAQVSGNTATVYISASAHRGERGAYITHIYVRDYAGQEDLRGVNVTLPQTQTSSGKPAITGADVTEVSSSGYRVTATFTAPAGVKEVLMPTWTEKNGQDDLVWHTAQVSGNTASFYVPASAHKGEGGAYITHIYLRDYAGREDLRGVNVTLPQAQTSLGKPAITGADVTEVSSSGYRVTASFTAPAGVKEVLMPTWTKKNGQDDLIWHTAQVSGNTASFYVSASAHKGEGGAYITHIYLRDNAGREDLREVNVTLPQAQTSLGKPAITGADVTEVSSAGYRVTASFTAPAGVKEVLMPTWTKKNGQDDLIWHTAQVSGNTASFYVSASAHKGEGGAYITHIYLRDNAGREDLREVNVTLPQAQVLDEKPVITGTNVTEVSSSGYRVTAAFTAPAGVREVLMPTWTEKNGQDDLIWHTAQVSGNTASFYVSASAHKGEYGNYITHIYVYDTKGRLAAIAGVNAAVAQPQTGGGSHVVCLDAGHQQSGISELEPNGPGSSIMKAKLTSGTAGCVTGLAEHQLNLTIALKLKQELINRGYQVVMIRESSDCPLSNAERAQVANSSGAEIFVRIHANSSANSAVSGAQFYAPSAANPYMNAGVISSSNTLSSVMLNAFCAATGAANRGLLQDDTMTGINWCTIPVTIAEMGFMSNPDEDRRMSDPSYQEKMVQGLANGIDAYFN